MSYRAAIALGTLIPVAYQGNSFVTNRDLGGVRRAPPTFVTVTTGTEHSCALTPAGRAYCWGSNRLGQLGDESAPRAGASADKPVAVATAETFVAISAGAGHTCALTAAGVAYCWGLDLTAELGRAVVADVCAGFPCSRRPVRVDASVRFDTIAAGFGHTCALSDGRAFCWGRNDRGQLGTARADDDCDGVPCNAQPVAVGAVERFSSISAGGDHTCALAAGVAYCWGSNQYGQLGRASAERRNPRPVAVEARERFRRIEARGVRTCATTVVGAVRCWGFAAGAPTE